MHPSPKRSGRSDARTHWPGVASQARRLLEAVHLRPPGAQAVGVPQQFNAEVHNGCTRAPCRSGRSDARTHRPGVASQSRRLLEAVHLRPPGAQAVSVPQQNNAEVHNGCTRAPCRSDRSVKVNIRHAAPETPPGRGPTGCRRRRQRRTSS